ncbi:putative vegetative incompatibility protein HET-E-1 [Rhizoctonia solani 123E]|uniref:Putative vegetative incompatibility protein HET-E-1 n=1 Tax=Rhizoctonia solani 123E TaxID=1423351 RepID=A0A074SCT4_9AGAM|nr:putative vegetative incompatibility protein HET-E-1 [Rhizoctonia solani 123E]
MRQNESLAHTPSIAPTHAVTSTTTAASTTSQNTDTGTSKHLNKLKGFARAAGSKLKVSFRAMSRVVGKVPPLKSALEDLSDFVGILGDLVDEDEDLRRLFDEFQISAIGLGSHIASLGLDHEVLPIAESLNQHLQYVKQCQEQYSLPGSEVMKRAREIEQLLKQLEVAADRRSRENTTENLAETQRQRLSPVLQASYNSSYAMTIQRGRCTAGTRQALQMTLQDWVQAEDNPPEDPQLLTTNNTQLGSQTPPKVFWMNGMAGTGKTTIAYSLCEWLETHTSNNRLGASFFCSRTSSLCRSFDKVIPTIAYQLGNLSSVYKYALWKSLHDDPDAATREVRTQFDKLIVRPMESVVDANLNGALVVIDALDECENTYGAETILELLLTHAKDLPIKFFITSRPEPAIRDKILSSHRSLSSAFHLHDIDASIVQGDIQRYLAEALKNITPPPTEDQIIQLAKQSGKLFIYASTLVRYISPRSIRVPSKSRLQRILGMNTQHAQTGNGQLDSLYRELDQLYSTVLEIAFAEDLEDLERTIVRDILETVVCVKEPISVETLAGLLGYANEEVSYWLSCLHSVLHVPESGGLISALHASFPEYLLNPSRAGQMYCCDESQRNGTLARNCFDIMKLQLRFNICNLGSSFVADNDVPDLQVHVKHSISSALSYACRFWGDHLRVVRLPISNDFHDMLGDFLSVHFLFWIEVMNLTKYIGIAVATLHQARLWLQVTLLNEKNTALMSFRAKSEVCSVTILYDSTHILFVTRFGRTGIWNLYGGTPSFKPFRDQSGVNSVAISADGAVIVTGTNYNTIVIYDGHRNTLLHTFETYSDKDELSSVAISQVSPIYVASGHSSNTIRLWDVVSKTKIAPVLKGHEGYINSIIFSPTCMRLASCSQDTTIRLWDHLCGTSMSQVLIGHGASVDTMAFSPNGALLVSGSSDKTIRLWDANTGSPFTQVFEGHTDGITSVAFSPDCNQVVSGSDDGAVQLWAVQTGKRVGQPFTRHAQRVSSVAFSPKGDYIVSSSGQTIQLWDASHCSASDEHATRRPPLTLSSDPTPCFCVAPFGGPQNQNHFSCNPNDRAILEVCL